MKKALTLPKKARARLAQQLWESLEPPADKISGKEWSQLWKTEVLKRMEEMESGKVKGIPGDRVMAELAAVYGRSKDRDPVLSQKEWDKAWEAELLKRIAEMESGEDPGVPLEVVLEDLRRLSRRR